MPEYGLCDKSPEELEEERFAQEMIATFKRAEAIEVEVRKRKAAAEDSSIKTAEMLRNMQAQVQKLSERLDAERQARQESEKAAQRSNRNTFIVAVISLIAAVLIGAITIYLQLSQQTPNRPVSPSSDLASGSIFCDSNRCNGEGI